MAQRQPKSIRVVWRTEMALKERIQLERDVASFRLAASHQDWQLFQSGHRLSREHRTALLDNLSINEVANRGLQFSDDPIKPTPPSQLLAEQKARTIREGVAHPTPAPTLSYRAILLDAWHVYDPMQLEWCIDGLRNGVSMAYEGPRSKGRSLANLKSGRIHRRAVEALVSKARARGFLAPNFDSPPVPQPLLQPCGRGPKARGPDPMASGRRSLTARKPLYQQLDS